MGGVLLGPTLPIVLTVVAVGVVGVGAGTGAYFLVKKARQDKEAAASRVEGDDEGEEGDQDSADDTGKES